MHWTLCRCGLGTGLRLLAICSAISAACAADDFTVSNRTEINSNTVTGPNASNASFLDPGTHIYHETDIRWSGQAFAGQWNSSLNSTLRYTDSRQFDPESLSLQKLQWRLSDAKTQIHVGDYFANLSPYAMTKGIKGLALQRNLGNDQNYVRALYGSLDSEWAFLLKDSAREPMNAVGGGIRWQQAWDKFRLGLNLAESHDVKDNARTVYPVVAQVLPALDWEYREAALVINGEHAYSDTNTTAAVGSADTHTSGIAHKIVARAALKSFDLDAHVERVTPNFVPKVGGATPDRLRHYAKVDYKLTKDWRLFAMYDDYRDNLDSQKTSTTEVSTMEGGFRQARAFGRRHMNISLSLRNKQQKQSDNTRDVTSKRIKFKVNDRVGDAYDWRAEVEQILDRDRVTASDATSTLYDLGLGYRRRLSSGWDIRGDFNLGRQETGTLNATGTDIANRWRVGLNADRGNGTVLGINLERNSADLVALNADNVHTRSSVYWQTKPAWLKDGSSKLEYADFIHAFTENAANDYREQVLKIILQWNL